MSWIMRFTWALSFGALLGALLFAWFSPGVIAWYFSPPADLVMSCKPSVQWAIETYRKVILSGMLMGVIVSGILFLALSTRKKNATQAALAAQAAAAPAPGGKNP